MKIAHQIHGFILSILLVLSCSTFAAVIDHVSYIGDNGDAIDMPLENLKTRDGETLRAEDVISDINTMKDKLPQYQNIVMNVNPIAGDQDRVDVIFEFQRKRTIKTIRILAENKLKIPFDLREKLTLQREGTFDSADLERDESVIKEYYINKGYPKVQVKHELLNYGNDEEVELTLTIVPNTNRLVVRKLKFKGNDSFEKKDLKKLFKMKPREFFLAKHTVFSVTQLDEDIAGLTQYYRDQGFLDVVVNFDYSYDLKGHTTISVAIEEGHQYKVKDIQFEHVSPIYTDADIQSIYDFSKVKNYNDKDLRIILQKIREYFGDKGHATVQAFSSYDSMNEILMFRIIEGPVYTIKNIKVEGNESMKAETVLLDLKLDKDSNFDASIIKKGMEDLKKTGYYETVQIDFVPTSHDDQTGEGDAIVTVKEAKTKTLSFGMGTGTNGVQGDLSFSDRNFLGTGNSVSLYVQKMAEMSKIGLVYKDPHLMNSDYSLSVAATYGTQNNPDYKEEKVATHIMIEKKLNENLKLGVGTRIEFLNLSDISQEIKMNDYNVDGKDKILGMIGTLLYKSETRDKAGDRKDGITINMALLPSYSDEGAYLKAYTTLMGSKSLYENKNGVDHTISGRLTVGYASKNAPFFEKFYAGGIGTLRGFKSKSIKTSSKGTGGSVLVSASTSYSFPVWEDKVKGMVFLEAASVGDSISDLGNVRAVGGIGVKANLGNTFIGSMIQAGIAIPLRKQDGDSVKPFYFIFGDYDPAYDL